MKKGILLFIAMLIVLGVLFIKPPKNVQAIFIGTNNKPSLAPGDWSTGTNVDVNFGDNPAPNWLQLLANPVKITESGQICHNFRGGQFGWVGEIRQLIDGEWVKVETTSGWVPNEEGVFMVCSNVDSGGTFALFGFFNPPLSYYPDYVEPDAAPASIH